MILYTSDGEARQEFSIVLTGRFLAGEATPSIESKEVHWVDPARLAELAMHRSMRRRIDDYLTRQSAPYFD